MSLSMYQASVPVFVTMLNNLTAILEKAETLAKERNIEESVLLNWRLTPDMFPFARQVQIAADFAKGTSARLAGAEAPSYADEEASFADLKRRIAKTIAFVKSFKPGDRWIRAPRHHSHHRRPRNALQGRALPFALRTAKFLFSRDHRLRPDARLRCYNRQAGLHRRNLSADLAMNMLRFLNEVSPSVVVARYRRRCRDLQHWPDAPRRRQ
jgi:uncharacterized protein